MFINRRKKNERQEPEWIDDGRVIADMTVEGMPGTISDRVLGGARAKRPTIDEFGNQIPAPEPVELNREERREVRRGVMRAYMLVGGTYVIGYILLMLFLVFVWMR